MSISVSNTNSNTVYILKKPTVNIPNTTRDPRPYEEALKIYFDRTKIKSAADIKRNKAEYERLTGLYNCTFCLNCLALFVEDIVTCPFCRYNYCKNCANMLGVNHDCLNCRPS